MSQSKKKPSIVSLVHQFVSTTRPSRIDQASLGQLLSYVAVRRGGQAPHRKRILDILLTTDVEISRALGGFAPDLRGRIRIGDLDAAQASLLEMAREYERVRAAGDNDRAQDCRRAVQCGRQRLEFLLSRPNLSEIKRQNKAELLEWFRVWIEAPALFEDWVILRRRSLS